MGTASWGEDRRGTSGRGVAGGDWFGVVPHVVLGAGLVEVRRCRQGAIRRDVGWKAMARQGSDSQAWHGKGRRGLGRDGKLRRGAMGRGAGWQVWSESAWKD